MDVDDLQAFLSSNPHDVPASVVLQQPPAANLASILEEGVPAGDFGLGLQPNLGQTWLNDPMLPPGPTLLDQALFNPLSFTEVPVPQTQPLFVSGTPSSLVDNKKRKLEVDAPVKTQAELEAMSLADIQSLFGQADMSKMLDFGMETNTAESATPAASNATPSTPSPVESQSSPTQSANPEESVPKKSKTTAAAEERRRRNTQASQRFRLRKKLKQKALEVEVEDLRQQAREQKSTIKVLRKENRELKRMLGQQVVTEDEEDEIPEAEPKPSKKPRRK